MSEEFLPTSPLWVIADHQKSPVYVTGYEDGDKYVAVFRSREKAERYCEVHGKPSEWHINSIDTEQTWGKFLRIMMDEAGCQKYGLDPIPENPSFQLKSSVAAFVKATQQPPTPGPPS